MLVKVGSNFHPLEDITGQWPQKYAKKVGNSEVVMIISGYMAVIQIGVS